MLDHFYLCRKFSITRSRPGVFFMYAIFIYSDFTMLFCLKVIAFSLGSVCLYGIILVSLHTMQCT